MTSKKESIVPIDIMLPEDIEKIMEHALSPVFNYKEGSDEAKLLKSSIKDAVNTLLIENHIADEKVMLDVFTYLRNFKDNKLIKEYNKYLAIDGGNKVGKTTKINTLIQKMFEQNIPVVILKGSTMDVTDLESKKKFIQEKIPDKNWIAENDKNILIESMEQQIDLMNFYYRIKAIKKEDIAQLKKELDDYMNKKNISKKDKKFIDKFSDFLETIYKGKPKMIEKDKIATTVLTLIFCKMSELKNIFLEKGYHVIGDRSILSLFPAFRDILKKYGDKDSITSNTNKFLTHMAKYYKLTFPMGSHVILTGDLKETFMRITQIDLDKKIQTADSPEELKSVVIKALYELLTQRNMLYNFSRYKKKDENFIPLDTSEKTEEQGVKDFLEHPIVKQFYTQAFSANTKK